MIRPLLLLIFLVCSLNTYAQKGYVHHWEMILEETEQWKYSIPKEEPDSNWYMPQYSTDNWYTTNTPLLANSDTVKTIYYSSKFNITNRDALSAMLFSINYDGGFVIYLNGYEVARENIGGRFNHPTISDTALYSHPFASKKSDYLVNQQRFVYALIQGENTIAIQLHHQTESSEIGLSISAYLGVINDSFSYHKTQVDFIPPPVFAQSSNLPVISINTGNNTLDSLHRIPAHMGITYSPLSEGNLFDGLFNHYDGQISVKYRGQSSLEFPKRSLSVETQTATGENNNVALLGLPAENDWVLYAPYADKSLIRNVFTYKLFEKMGHYAPRCRFVELYINDYYQGVYVFTEKIKRDKYRVDISKLSPNEIFGDDLTGGYIIRNDKAGIVGETAWKSTVDVDAYGYRQAIFQLDYPEMETIAPEQLQYIQAFCDSMEYSILGLEYSETTPKYTRFIDMNSWVDKFIITELSKDIDSYRYSEYMYKQKNSNGGKMVMGPVWDYNTGYGNLNYGSNTPWDPEGWMIHSSSHQLFWYKQLFQDTYFTDEIYERWFELRNNVLSEDKLFAMIDSMTEILDQAQVRNHYQWKTLGRYVWPNNFVAETYEEEITFLKDWIDDRLYWIDENLPEPAIAVSIGTEETKSYSFPNPFMDEVYFHHKSKSGKPFTISITNSAGDIVSNITTKNDNAHIRWETSQLPAGVFVYSIREEGSVVSRGKLVKL